MYELSRVRLFSVGPPGARYQDVCLDFRGLGAPVRAPRQVDLFAADDLERVPRRPSPASVLYLENGGGKSVLLKLIFSVLLPGRRQVVGTTNTRVLEKFVLADDVAHVALEWMHAGTGDRLVTGKVSEWRGHTVSADPAKLIDAWYSFRPGQTLGLGDLPFTVEQRRVTLGGFKERLDAANRAESTLRLVWATVHREWSQHLIELGLDPELFGYQRAMNAGEGEAAEAFSFPSDEAFVDFLLRAVLDQEEPEELAEVVAGYAAKIAQRSELELEREFVEGTLDRLGPLAAAELEAAAAGEREAMARQEADKLAGSLLARRSTEAARLEIAHTALDDATAAARSAAAEQRRMQSVSIELRRLVAELKHRAATRARDDLQKRRDDAAELAEAWRGVEPVLREQLAAAEGARLRTVVAEEQERARPALEARQAAAAALARALRTIIDDALDGVRQAEQRAADSARQAQAARAREVCCSGEAARHRAAVDQAHAELGRISGLISTAVCDGVLPSGDDVGAAAARAQDEQRAAIGAVEDTLTELARLRAARRAEDARLADARAGASAAVAAADSAQARWRRADLQRAELATEPRLAELLGADSVHLDADAAALLERLAASLRALHDERSALREAQRRDQRTLRALGEGGLLPEPAEVEQTLRVLDRAGITAQSGWRYLSRLPEQNRSALLTLVPHLISGVLLSDQSDVPRAQEALTEARLLPCSLIVVGATDSIDSTGAFAPFGVHFVIAPNPAMFDEAAAGRAHAQLIEETRLRAQRLAAVDSVLERDRALAERLRQWRQSFPPGSLDELAEASRRALAEADAAQTRVAELTAAVEELDLRSDQLDNSLPRLREAESIARDRAARLARLCEEAAKRSRYAEVIAQATAAASAADAQAAQARAAAEQAQRDGQEHLRAQDRHAGVVATARDDLAELPTELVTEAVVSSPAPTQPLSVLRTEYRRAQATYAAVEVDVDLRAALSAAEREAEAARSAAAALPDRVRELASDLLRGPDGSSVSARRAAAGQAVRTLRELESRLRSAHTELALTDKSKDEYRPQRVALDPYGVPENLEQGAALIERADRDRRAVELAASAAQAREEAAQAAVSAIAATATGFGRLAGALDELAPADEPEEPVDFVGDVDLAAERLKAVRAAVREAVSVRDRAVAEVRRLADDVARHAQDTRFDTISSPVRRHILGVSRAEMPGLAREWATALRPRLRSLDDDLVNIGRHRSGIVTRLQGVVGEAVRTLRLAQRLSQLPDGLSDWSGQQFLRIRFAEIDDDVLLAQRLGEVVDRTAAGYVSGGRERRDGMSLLLRGVRAAMPKGVCVELLKPDAVLRAERLRVCEVRDVFSGGQQLTAAIVLYCTMAALRAHQRGESGRPHAGVLFLDNPIGRASASYLLELQFGVAKALGVQLVYTTGLFDTGVLSSFPLIVRLRNDAALRAGR
ncbi:MAG: hypothetical protein JO100_09915, partial [Pseudonocardia sp.]|nr:hypothetical protein [Pseudonocardia sp.]